MKKQIMYTVITVFLLTVNSMASAYTEVVDACHNRDMKGCYELGNHFQLRKEYQKAMRYHQMACENGYDKSCLAIGKMYQYGKGLKKNLSKASQHYRTVCKRGNGEGCSMLGVLEMKKKSGTTKKALSYFDEGCKKGDAFGCSRLAYYRTSGTYGEEDHSSAKISYERACNLDRKECLVLGNAYVDAKLGLKRNYNKAKHYYSLACEGGSHRACYKLGNLYYKGSGVKKSYVKAKEYYIRSCQSDMLQDGSERGCNNLAVLYHYGRGVKKDLTKAKQYYNRACLKGYGKACETVKVLK